MLAAKSGNALAVNAAAQLPNRAKRREPSGESQSGLGKLGSSNCSVASIYTGGDLGVGGWYSNDRPKWRICYRASAAAKEAAAITIGGARAATRRAFLLVRKKRIAGGYTSKRRYGARIALPPTAA